MPISILVLISLGHLCSLMSDYEVSLVNDNMQEFFVRFYGPPESMGLLIMPNHLTEISLSLTPISTFRRRRMENSCRAPRSVPFQVS